jgi:hypothetical protein
LPPWGLDGGCEGAGNAVELRVAGQWKTDFPNAKVLVAQLKPGDAFKIRSGGGGGYGDPLQRPIDEVREDVRQGYVTVKSAAELYGVVLDPETFEVDIAATEKLRAATLRRHAAAQVPSRPKYLHATAVVPAKAGTHGALRCGLWNMDPRLRGDDIGGWALAIATQRVPQPARARRCTSARSRPQWRELTGCQRRAAAREHALGSFCSEHGPCEAEKLLVHAGAVERARGIAGDVRHHPLVLRCPAATTRTRAGQLRG